MKNQSLFVKNNKTRPKETELYAPIKARLENQGYEVKGEVGKADIVAVRGEEDPVIVELKTAFSLSLFHQGIERQSLTPHVYIAVPRGKGRLFRKSLQNNKALCQRLGLGLITVQLGNNLVEIHHDPRPYQPRQSKLKKTCLLREFNGRIGDPNQGGSSRRLKSRGVITLYRQNALLCVQYLARNGPSKAAIVAKTTTVDKARNIMADNYYGWFERVDRGIYELTSKGELAFKDYKVELENMAAHEAFVKASLQAEREQQ